MASSSQLSKCLICKSPSSIEPRFKSQKIGQSSNLNQTNLAIVSEELDVIFTLRTMMNIPSEICEAFLKQHGSPSEWGIILCSNCKDTFLHKAQGIHKEISILQKQLSGVRTEVVSQIKSNFIGTENDQSGGEGDRPKTKPRGKRKYKTDHLTVFTKVRTWIVDNDKSNNSSNESQIEKRVAALGGIDKFVAVKSTEKAFNKAGPGRKLGEEPGPSSSSLGISLSKPSELPVILEKDTTCITPRIETSQIASEIVSEEKRCAAAAALARVERNRKPSTDSKELLASRQSAFIKEQARKELEEELIKNSMDQENGLVGNSENISTSSEMYEAKIVPRVIDPASYVVKGVFFRCPRIGVRELLPEKEVEARIQEYLFRQLKKDKDEIDVTSCLLIYSCNKPVDRVKCCVDTLTKYFDNIIRNPNEVKFRQIRCSNPVFKERVASVVGAEQFLSASGFEKTWMPIDSWDEREEEFWAFKPEDETDCVADLIELRETLKNTSAIRPELDRNIQLLQPTQVQTRTELPDEFYILSSKEIKAEQQVKTEKMELELTLRTKAMRERDEIREKRMYRYGVIRIRFPDALILQGTFGATEKLSNVFDFVRNNLVEEGLEFSLIKCGGENLNNLDMNSTLAELRLTPSSVLNFRGENVPADGPLATSEISYLKPEVLSLIYNF